MNITELIELNDKAHEVLGWRSGGSIDLGYNVEEVGDCVLYLEIHDSIMTQTDDLLLIYPRVFVYENYSVFRLLTTLAI